MRNSTRIATLESGEAEWAAAIAKGAPPFERLRHPAFHIPGPDRAGIEMARCWMDTASGGLPHLQGQLLTAFGHDDSSVERAFGPARIKAGKRLPPWAECLIQTVRALPEDAPSVPGEDPSLELTTWLLSEAAARLLDWEHLRVRYPFIHERLLFPLTRQLVIRIILTCGSSLELENRIRADETWDFTRRAWMDRLCGFAGLNFVVGTAVRQWKQNTLEILTRVGQDLPLLNLTLFKGAPPDALVEIEGDLGDRHNDGRSVAVLTFAGGGRVVYKPKDLRCASQFMELLAFLNAAAESPRLPTRQIICRGSYAWEEYVDERTAESDAGVESYFRRFGAFLRVLQLVEGRDFWLDNLRICGDLPVFVDLECILSPRFKDAGAGGAVMGLDRELYEESVLPTAAVTHPLELPGVSVQDFGGLSMPGPRLLPLGVWSGYRDRRYGNLWSHQGRLYWEPQLAWPKFRGEPADPADHLDYLERGCSEAHRLLRRCAPALLGAASPLRAMSEVPVRVLMRSTWEYLALLRASLEPMALLDGNARELALANVLSTSPGWGASDETGLRFAIARSELDALRILDIPEFYSLPSSTSATDTFHRTFADVFDGCAYDRLRSRLTDVDSFDLEAHLRILRSAVNSMTRTGLRPTGTAN
jgi:hypothetical protein